MSDEKKKVIAAEDAAKENEAKEISDDQLKDVTGGSIRDVRFTKTGSISQDTKDKV